MTLAARLLELHRCLDAARIPHAFGGAIALAYWTLDPRGTSDIDVNVFVPATDPGAALAALPSGIKQHEATFANVARDGQVRLWWQETPVDLFFDYVPVHADAARNRRMVPFEGHDIPILGPIELAVFKAMFDRTRDWADIEAMLAAGTLDLDETKGSLKSLVSDCDHRFTRLDAAFAQRS